MSWTPLDFEAPQGEISFEERAFTFPLTRLPGWRVSQHSFSKELDGQTEEASDMLKTMMWGEFCNHIVKVYGEVRGAFLPRNPKPHTFIQGLLRKRRRNFLCLLPKDGRKPLHSYRIYLACMHVESLEELIMIWSCILQGFPRSVVRQNYVWTWTCPIMSDIWIRCYINVWRDSWGDRVQDTYWEPFSLRRT